MKLKLVFSRLNRIVVCGAVALLLLLTTAVAQTPDDEATRKLWDTGFLQKRPASAKPGRTAAANAKTKYKRVTPPLPTDSAMAGTGSEALVGITVWRLRPVKPADEARILVYRRDTKKAAEFTPERVASNAPLARGQRVRLSIEAPRTGYLYVIDREQYADGSLSQPYLVYPVPHADNKVMAGRVIEIPPPGEDGAATYFELQSLERSNQPAQIAEMLTVLISPEPLPGLKLSEEPLALPNGMMDEWEKKWGAQSERLELVGGAGRAYTKAEKAAAVSSRRLTSVDPLPQTIYRVAAKPGNPLLVSVPLNLATEDLRKDRKNE